MISIEGITRKCLLLAGCAAIVCSTSAAWAQTADAESPDADDNAIIVTAQRRAERLVDVPMSITALSGDQLINAGVTSVHDIANVTAGVQINFAGCCTQPAVRGISTLTTGIGFENNVALYVDGFYTPDNVTINSDLANIESVQVLKGPQGTLWGRNATGGAILINTLAPSKELTGKVTATYGRFNDKSISGYLSAPLGEKVAFSVAGYARRGDGYNKFVDATGKVIGNATPVRQTSIRAKLQMELTDDLKLTWGYNYGLSSDGRGNLFTIVGYPAASLPASPPRPSGPFRSGTNRQTDLTGRTNELTAKIELQTGAGTLTSYTGYAVRKTHLAYDFDGSWVDLNGSEQFWTQKTFQQSLDFNVEGIEHVDLVIGGTYYKDKLSTPLQIGYGGNAVTSLFATTLRAESLAGFIDGTYHLSDALSISAGARYTHETKKGAYANFTPAGVATANFGDNATSFNAFTPRGTIRYEFAPRSSVYASISRGFRSGGFQPNGAINDANYLPFLPEKITAYELGLKVDRPTFTFSGAFFYYDYANLQVGVTIPNPAQPNGLISKVINAKKAEVYGIDGDISWRPLDGLNVHLGAAWLHGRYKDFANATGTGLDIASGLNVTNQPQNWTGQQMTRAPDYTVNLGIDYTIQDVAGGALQLGGNLHYTSSFITNSASLYGPLAGARANQQRYRQGAYVLLNLQANWTDPSDHFTLGVFGNNVTNKIYRLTYSGGGFGDYSSWASPATYGARIGYKF